MKQCSPSYQKSAESSGSKQNIIYEIAENKSLEDNKALKEAYEIQPSFNART